MSKSLAVLLCVVFVVTLAIVYKVGGGIQGVPSITAGAITSPTATASTATAQTTTSAAAKQELQQQQHLVATNNNNDNAASSAASKIAAVQNIDPVSNVSNKSLSSTPATVPEVKVASQINAIKHQHQLQQHVAKIKITSPTRGQQVPVGKDLTISGTSIDNATSNNDCKVSVIVNKVRPFQPATATTAANNDYSKWNYVLTPKYTTIKPGPNGITAKYECANNPPLTSFFSVNVTGVPPAVSATATPKTTPIAALTLKPLQAIKSNTTISTSHSTLKQQILLTPSNGTAGQNSILASPSSVVAADKAMFLGYHDISATAHDSIDKGIDNTKKSTRHSDANRSTSQIVSKVEGGIEKVAYAQIGDFSPIIQNQNVNNLHVNSNSIPQHNDNNKISITSNNCIAAISDIQNTGLSSRADDNVSMSPLSSSPSKTSSRCDAMNFFNSCRKNTVSHSFTSAVPTAKSLKQSNVIEAKSNHEKEICDSNHDNHTIRSEGTQQNRLPITSLSQNRIASWFNLPNNLIVPTSCPDAGSTTTTGSQGKTTKTTCPSVIGTNRADIIIATEVPSATIYALEGNDVIQCGPGDCITYSGPGDNIMMASSSNTAKLFGGSGNNVFIGSAGNSLMVGDKGNDQFYGGTGHDVMVGGGGTNYFDCGPNGNAVILDFDPNNGDKKAPNCKYTISANTAISPLIPYASYTR